MQRDATALASGLEESRLLFISWAPDCSRSDSIAARLGGASHMIYSPFWGSNYLTVGFKYVSQSLKTSWLLLRTRPRMVFVMAPPVVACIPVWIYCLLFRSQFVIDAHTAAFDNPRWRKLQFIQRFLSRRAATTIVTNEHLEDILRGWGVDSTIISDVPIEFASPASKQLESGCNMVLVSSFCDDEPIEEFLKAARQVPAVRFHVTGDNRGLSPTIQEMAPKNVRFTGFLKNEEYVGLLLAADAVIALTTRDHTMQRAAYEAVYLGKPVITSDFPLLRRSFHIGTLHVTPAAEAIAAAVREMRVRLPVLCDEVQQLRDEKLVRWDQVAVNLKEKLGIQSRSASQLHASRATENTEALSLRLRSTAGRKSQFEEDR